MEKALSRPSKCRTAIRGSTIRPLPKLDFIHFAEV
jgi:hypothetical protein